MTTAETVTAFAPAKINLTLHVTGQRADGYHLLDSLVVFADVGDRLWLTPGSEISLSVKGPFSRGVPCDQRNLVWRAAEYAGWTGHIQLEKNLPHGAGIGGGSSDAAAVLRALDVSETGLALGADVPVCRVGRAVRMQGIGDVLTPVGGLGTVQAVLVNPHVHLPTPDVFGGLVHKRHSPMRPEMPDGGDLGAWLHWLDQQRNDLEAVAQARAPEVGHVLSALEATPGVDLARMSGSGTTCFGLCAALGAHVQAAEAMRAAHPDWWVVPCLLG